VMPFKSEHSARQLDPRQFDDFRREHEDVAPDGIDFIYGINLDGTSEIQSVRADAELWTAKSFQAWLVEHDLTAEFLEPAREPAAPEATRALLQSKTSAHNERSSGDLTKRTNADAVYQVYERGLESYGESERPGISRGEWAMARVEAFFFLLSEGRPKSLKYMGDNDLLPAGHPRSSKSIEADSRELATKERLPGYICEALKKGLKLHEGGRSGDGLSGNSVLFAEVGASDGFWTHSMIISAADWFNRNESKRTAAGRWWSARGGESPVYVSWLLSGSDSNNRGKVWIEKKAEELRKEGAQVIETENALTEKRTATEMAFEPKPGDPLEEFRDKDSRLAPMIQADDLSEDENKDLHVLRLGALYDLDSGDLVMNLTEEAAREIARTTDRMIQAGHVLPVSFEHGIEGGQRGQDGSDRRPYGQIHGVYYDQARRGIYARKEWTKIGRGLLLDSMTDDGLTAIRVSPRVIMKPAYHPSTGERLGESYMDVISLTTLPRQDSMEPVALSRTMITVGAESCSAPILETAGTTAIPEGVVTMTEKTEEKTVEVLLARGSDDARTLYTAAGLEESAPVVELARKFEALNAELSRSNEELSKYRNEELSRLAAEKEAEVLSFLDQHNVGEVEREFFKVSLLSEDQKTAELARETIIARGAPDTLAAVEDALTEAKKRGAVPADFVVEGELAELSRTAPDVAVGIINAIPGENVVRVGEPAGSDVAGVETTSALNKEQAGVELSRLARKLKEEGKAGSLIDAHRIAKTERPDLVAALKEN